MSLFNLWATPKDAAELSRRDLRLCCPFCGQGSITYQCTGAIGYHYCDSCGCTGPQTPRAEGVTGSRCRWNTRTSNSVKSCARKLLREARVSATMRGTKLV